MKLAKYKGVNVQRIVGGILLGFFSRIVYEQITSASRLSNKKTLSLAQDPDNANCPPCAPQTCPHCLPQSVAGTLPTDAALPYKPKGMYEVTRWLYFDEKAVYDIINEEPRVPLSGHWREDAKAVAQVGLDYINANQMMGHSWQLVALKDGYARTDSQRGIDYMLDLVVRPTTLNVSKSTFERTFRVRMVHPFENTERAKSLSVKKEVQGKIKIIVPISHKSVYAESFIDAYIKEKLDSQAELIFVLFTGIQLKDRENAKALADRITKKSNVKSVIKTLEKEGEYNYLKGVYHGALKAAQSSDIVVALTEDVQFSEQFLVHCRAIVDPGKRVYFPVAFEQYDPDVIERGMPPGKPKNINKKDHNKFTGYWAHRTHDFICAHRVDLVGILSGSRLDPDADQGTWAYDMFLRKEINVFSGIEPNLFRVHTDKKCDKAKLTASQYLKCFEAQAKCLGSKPALGILYITEVVQKKVKH